MTEQDRFNLAPDLAREILHRRFTKKSLQQFLDNFFHNPNGQPLCEVDESGLVTDYAFIYGINPAWGYVDIYYLKVPYGDEDIYITEIGISDD